MESDWANRAEALGTFRGGRGVGLTPLKSLPGGLNLGAGEPGGPVQSQAWLQPAWEARGWHLCSDSLASVGKPGVTSQRRQDRLAELTVPGWQMLPSVGSEGTME